MAGIARLEAKISTTTPLGVNGPLSLVEALAITVDTGPLLVRVLTGVSGQAVRIIGTQGITTVTGLVITSDQTISVSYNGGTAIPLTANGFHMFSNTSITAMAITNASGNTANVTHWLVGS